MSSNLRLQGFVGPPSDTVNLLEFKTHSASSLLAISGYTDRFPSSDPAIRDRCSVDDIVQKTSDIFTRDAYMRDARAWQLTRMITGSDRPDVSPQPAQQSQEQQHQQEQQQDSAAPKRKRRKASAVGSSERSSSSPAHLDPEFCVDRDRILISSLRQAHVHPHVKYFMRHTRLADSNTLSSLLSAVDGSAHTPVSPNELLITVTLYPISNLSSKHLVTAQAQVLHFLSSSTISQLRDNLICTADATPTTDPTTGEYTHNRMVCPSVIMIENVVYPDRRVTASDESDSPERLVSHIQEFLRSSSSSSEQNSDSSSYSTDRDRRPSSSSSSHHPTHHHHHPHHHHPHPLHKPIYGPSYPGPVLSSVGMEDTTWDSLNLRLGAVYWMRHAGNCEHLFSIDSIRLFHPNDPLPSEQLQYPLSTFLSRSATPKCRVCERDPAAVVTVDDELGGDSPALMCETCFRLLHGNDNGGSSSGSAGDALDLSIKRNFKTIPMFTEHRRVI